MSYKMYNDYELLYLAINYQDTVALDIIFNKYSNFIYKKAISFFPHENNVDDYYQEGILSLYKCIYSFDENYNKTFMRYFEVILNRNFINIYNRKKRDYQKIINLINESKVRNSFIVEEKEVNYDIPLYSFKSPIEDSVYNLYFLKGKNIKEISNILKKTNKQIYNAIYRIRKKIEIEVNNSKDN